MIVVYDTMVFLQNASRPDRTHASWQAVKDGRVSLCISGDLAAEVQDVLNRNRLSQKFPALNTNVAEVFTADLLARGVMIDPVPHAFSWPHHPDDDHLFNLAIAAKAERLVTFEDRILKMNEKFPQDFERLQSLAPQLRIITPKDLAQEFRTTRDGDHALDVARSLEENARRERSVERHKEKDRE